MRLLSPTAAPAFGARGHGLSHDITFNGKVPSSSGQRFKISRRFRTAKEARPKCQWNLLMLNFAAALLPQAATQSERARWLLKGRRLCTQKQESGWFSACEMLFYGCEFLRAWFLGIWWQRSSAELVKGLEVAQLRSNLPFKAWRIKVSWLLICMLLKLNNVMINQERLTRMQVECFIQLVCPLRILHLQQAPCLDCSTGELARASSEYDVVICAPCGSSTDAKKKLF